MVHSGNPELLVGHASSLPRTLPGGLACDPSEEPRTCKEHTKKVPADLVKSFQKGTPISVCLSDRIFVEVFAPAPFCRFAA